MFCIRTQFFNKHKSLQWHLTKWWMFLKWGRNKLNHLYFLNQSAVCKCTIAQRLVVLEQRHWLDICSASVYIPISPTVSKKITWISRHRSWNELFWYKHVVKKQYLYFHFSNPTSLFRNQQTDSNQPFFLKFYQGYFQIYSWCVLGILYKATF
jgi:hypothetical protein